MHLKMSLKTQVFLGIGVFVLFIFIFIFLLKKVILKFLHKKFPENVFILSVRKYLTLWGIILGLYFSIFFFPLPQRYFIFLQKFLIGFLIFTFTLWLASFISLYFENYEKRIGTGIPKASIVKNLIYFSVTIIGLMIFLQYLGISITPLITTLGIGGLAIALALRDTLANFFAGLHIIMAKQVKVGDYIKIETGEEGYVTDINWRNTTIQTFGRNLVIIPNTKLVNSIVINYHLPHQDLLVKVDVGVAYDSDLEKVEKITLEVAKEVLKKYGGAENFEPFIRYHTFGDFSINFTVFLKAKDFTSQFQIKHEFIKKLHKRYAQEGIEIPFPIRTIYMKK